jgi:UDP-glucose 4-epimerase
VPSPETVLVTGGAGFIGSHLVDRLLAEGRRVVAVDDLSTGHLANLDQARRDGSGRFEFQRLDITRSTLDAMVERHRPEVILHLAAQTSVPRSVEDPVSDALANVVGTINVLEAAQRHGVDKVVMASSGGALYGDVVEAELPVAEERALAPRSPYGASKAAAEQYLAAYGARYGLRWTSLALANVYGPRQDPAGEAGVVAVFTDRMLDDRPCMIHGDGEQSRDLVFVDDAVHAFVLAMDRGDGERFNIGTGQRTSVNQLFRALAAATGYAREPVHAPEREGEIRHSAVDARKAAQGLDWKPWTTLEEGLAATLGWAGARR